MVRIGNRDPQLWNIAADYAVNQILKDSNIGEMPKGKKGENKGFQDDKYKDWPAERIYDDIMKNAKKIDLSKLGELLDEHVDWGKDEGQGGGSGNKDGKGKEGKGKSRESPGCREAFVEKHNCRNLSSSSSSSTASTDENQKRRRGKCVE